MDRDVNVAKKIAVHLGAGKDVVVFTNPGSSTGFEIQFPTAVGGMRENRRRPLNEESLELLQDPVRCGLLHKGVVIKLTRPSLIFKKKTPDGRVVCLCGPHLN